MKHHTQGFLVATTVFVAAFLSCTLFSARGQGTAFTYQGRLNDGNGPATGIYDLRFTVYDALANGAAIGQAVTNPATIVSNGLFTIPLDFGAGVFTGANRWLEIAVRTNGGGTFTALSSRQQLTPSPYAIYASSAGSANTAGTVSAGNIVGLIPDIRLSPNVARLNVANTATAATATPTVTSGFITGATLTSGGFGYVTSPTVTVNDTTGSGAVLTATISGGSVTSLTVNNAGSGYSSGATLTIAPPPNNAYQIFSSLNFFTGSNVFSGIIVATNASNVFSGRFSGDGAGLSNLSVSSFSGTIPDTLLSSNVALVNGNPTFIGTVTALNFGGNGGGLSNVNAQTLGGLAAGQFWRASGNAGTVAGSNFLGTTDNQPLELKAGSTRALRIEPNTNGAPNMIGGSPLNFVDPGIVGATIAGGGTVDTNFFLGGGSNRVAAIFGTIGGGRINTVGADHAFIGGGISNTVQTFAYDSVIGGGVGNLVQTNGFRDVIGGGDFNVIQQNADHSIIGGGGFNRIIGSELLPVYSTIVGGWNNSVQTNTAYAVVGGGYLNSVNGSFGSIPGGDQNLAGTNSFAAGHRAKALHRGSFVWGDATEQDIASTGTNQFVVRANGGVHFITGGHGIAVDGSAGIPGAEPWQVSSGTNVLAQPNTGYVVNDPAQVTVTLPTNANVGEIVSVNGLGAGGWSVIPGAGQFISAPENLQWTAHETNRQWYSVASSADGTRLAAVEYDGRIYTSMDSGTSWVPRENVRRWRAIACSADGRKLVAVANDTNSPPVGERIYTSTDGGTNWTARESNRLWVAVASSADGNKLVAVDYYGSGAGGRIYTSTDGGISWTPRESNRYWWSVASSADGTRLIATTYFGPIYISTDSGVTWTPRENNRYWFSVASSADGMKLVAVVGGYFGVLGQIYTSTDGGTNWIPRENNRSWYSVASSADGTKLIASAGYGPLYTSTNSGVTWSPRASNRYWWSVSSSADGSKLVAAVNGGQIYTWPSTMLAGAQDSMIELQYLGNGRWQPVNNPNFIAGNLGVGTLAPAQKIHVVAPEARLRLEATSGNAATEYQTDARTWHTGVGSWTDPNGLGGSYYIFDATAGQTKMVVGANGVGIGTTYPNSALDVRAGGSTLSVSSNGVGIGTSYPGAALDVRTTNPNGNALRFGYYTGPGSGNLIAGLSRVSIATDDLVERVTILQGSGIVGIGTTTPSDALLDVEGAVRVNDWPIYLRGGNDPYHGLSYRYSFGTSPVIDGPALYGYSGGVLGTFAGVEAWSLRWNSSGQVFTRGAINPSSDRNVKENFTAIDPDEVLAKVAALPITQWNYIDDPSAQHIGPMAQDFYAAFHVGTDDKHIATVDADGVALAAIQGLNQRLTDELKRRDSENAELKRKNDSLESRLAALEKIILGQKSN